MKAIDGLMGSVPNTPDGDALEVLATLVEACEARHWLIEAPDPVSMTEHVMEARGLRQRDLASLIGSQPHASEVLNRQRPLALPMIRALTREWKLPADTLCSSAPNLSTKFQESGPVIPLYEWMHRGDACVAPTGSPKRSGGSGKRSGSSESPRYRRLARVRWPSVVSRYSALWPALCADPCSHLPMIPDTPTSGSFCVGIALPLQACLALNHAPQHV